MKTSRTAKLLLAALLSCAWLGCATNYYMTPELIRLHQPELQSKLEEDLRAALHKASSRILMDSSGFSLTNGNSRVSFNQTLTTEPTAREYFLIGERLNGILKARIRNGQLREIDFTEGYMQIGPTGRKVWIDVLK